MDIREFFSLDQTLPLLQAKADELYNLVSLKKKSLSKVPKGRLKIRKHFRQYQCFQVIDDVELYISQDKECLAKALAQKGYDQEILDEATKALNALNHFLKLYKPDLIPEFYEKLHEKRKAFVTPVRFPDEVFAKMWLEKKYVGRPFDDESPELLTSTGVRVRSKSEVIIADALARFGVPYRYEFPYQMKCTKKGEVLRDECSALNRGVSSVCREKRRQILRVCPDFTCVDLRTRREFIWEHFGMVDSPEYAKNFVEKMKMYAENGYVEGVNLIATYETKDCYLSVPYVERLIKLVIIDSSDRF